MDTVVSLDEHFAHKAEAVRQTYDAIVAAAQQFGPVNQDPKKTSIHLSKKTAFAGVQTRRDSLVLTLKAENDISSARIERREQVSAHRWHLEVRLVGPEGVDRELVDWLHSAYLLAK